MITTHVPEHMARKAGAAARVVLLMMAVVFFAILWDSDSPQARDTWLARRAALRHRAAAISPTVSVSVRAEPAPSVGAQSVPEVRRSRSTTAIQTVSSRVEESLTAADQHWTLPAGIAPGTYRVVDSTGRISLLTVPAASVSEAGPAPEMYTVEQGALRIYYIRLQAVDVIAQRP